MKQRNSYIALSLPLLLIGLLVLNVPQAHARPHAQAATTAEYRVTFNSEWSEETHPTDFPSSDPHMSGLIGGTHNSSVSFWAPGELASQGVKDVAERGNKTAMRSEVEAAINNGRADAVLSGGGIPVSPASVSLDFDVNSNFPLVSLISMIAPSPDWFVGVHDVSLLDANGNWINELIVELEPYDSGTDSAPNYFHNNAPTNPPVPIFNLTGMFPVGDARFGTFVFERLDAPPIQRGDVSCNGEVDSVDALFILQWVVDLREDGGQCPLGSPTEELHLGVADFNGDETVNAVDALQVLQCVVGLDNGFCGEVIENTASVSAASAWASARPSIEAQLASEASVSPSTATELMMLVDEIMAEAPQVEPTIYLPLLAY